MNHRPLFALASMILGAMLYLPGSSARADAAFDTELNGVRDAWAVARYQLPADQQEAAFEKLMARSAAFADHNPQQPEALIWDGIVQSTYAGVHGGLGALGAAKRAKARFEAALAIDERALDGSAYTSLGTLYHKVPGWPIGFGSDEKARQCLEKALAISPGGIDPNYFYGEFLYDDGDYAQALKHLQAAQQAPPRPGRELADAGRQGEIRELLAKVRKKLR
ncbi:MAG: hypothetical protein AMXMBFR45_09180 [Gammaproteobacteria bacterium]|nr:MAG: hypothetical protein BroJett010_13740 [Gammaproteobacteria bacterium]